MLKQPLVPLSLLSVGYLCYRWLSSTQGPRPKAKKVEQIHTSRRRGSLFSHCTSSVRRLLSIGGPNTQLPLNARRNECRRTCNACANRSLVHLIQLLETGNVIRLASFRARLADRHSVTGNGSGTPCAWTFGCLARACKELQCACLGRSMRFVCPKMGNNEPSAVLARACKELQRACLWSKHALRLP